MTDDDSIPLMTVLVVLALAASFCIMSAMLSWPVPASGRRASQQCDKVERPPTAYTAVVHYVYTDGTQAAPDQIKEVTGKIYIASPIIEGFYPDAIAIGGTEPFVATVTYHRGVKPSSTWEYTEMEPAREENLNKAYDPAEGKFQPECPESARQTWVVRSEDDASYIIYH